MQLLYVVHQFFPACHSGTEQYCLASAREARRRGDDVTILSLEPIWDRDDEPFTVFEQDYDGFRVPRLRHAAALNPNEILRDYDNPLVAARFGAMLDELRPAAIHFFHLRLLGSDLLEVAHARGVRSVVHLMDFWYLCPRFTLRRHDGSLCEGPPQGGIGCLGCAYPELLPAADATLPAAIEAALAHEAPPHGAGDTFGARLIALLQRQRVQLARLSLADAIVAPSKFLARMFVANGLPAERVSVVPYGLEPGRVVRSDVVRPRSPLRVGFAGVLSPWKAPHLLVEAVLALPDLPLEVTIHGRTEEFMFQDYIDAMRARAAPDARIRFPGAFGREQLDRVLADTDVLVVPSTWYENTPFVVLEAFEAGVPVLASDLGGLAEVVRDGQNGFTFEAGSAPALAALLARLVADPSLLRALTVEPRGSIADDYTRFRELYSSARATTDSKHSR